MLALYKKLGVPVYGMFCEEKEMPFQVPVVVDEVRPDILVITGHDRIQNIKGKQMIFVLIVIQKTLFGCSRSQKDNIRI